MLYLLVYRDGTFMTWRAGEPNSRHYEAGTRLFRVSGKLTLMELSDWFGGSMSETKGMVEITDW